MGILPDARGLYREDVIPPDITLNGPRVGSISAVFVTHSHLDHAGAIGLLRPDIPIVAGALTAVTLKAIQDSGKNEIGIESVYASVRRVDRIRNVQILRSSEHVLGRDLHVVERTWSPNFEDFWDSLPGQTEKSRKTYTAGTLHREPADLDYKSSPVDHSVLDARGFVISTQRGNVVYPGDFRMHGSRGILTNQFVDMAKSPRPYALFLEGTNAGSSRQETTTEEDVKRNARDLVAGLGHDLVIADFGARNIERLQTFLGVARENTRNMVVTTKDAYLLLAMNTVDHTIPLPGDDISVYDSPKAQEGRWEQQVIERFSGATTSPGDIRDSPGEYILAFGFFDIKHLVDLRPKGGHYIYSSSEAFTEEQEIDLRRLNEWLARFGMTRHGFDFDANGRPTFPGGPGGLHASGHAAAADLVEIARKLNPEVIVPVHTTNPQWFVEELGDEFEVRLPELSQWLEL